jgi:hypothetical protein
LNAQVLSSFYHFAIPAKLQALAKNAPVVMSHVKLVDIVFTYQMTQKKLHFVPAIHPIMQDAMIEQFVPFKKDMDICAS